MKTMANHHHSNPFISIISGALFSLYAFVEQHGMRIETFLELIKVISFGLIGGTCGYIGKIIALRVHKYLKEKSKNACK